MRGNGFATKPRVKGVTGSSRRQINRKRQRTRAMYAAQHLTKGEVDGAKTVLVTLAR